MNIKLKYLKHFLEIVDSYPKGIPFSEHTILAEVDGQIFKESFIVTSAMKNYNYREEALLFGIKLERIGKEIKKQAKYGEPTMTACSNGETIVTF